MKVWWNNSLSPKSVGTAGETYEGTELFAEKVIHWVFGHFAKFFARHKGLVDLLRTGVKSNCLFDRHECQDFLEKTYQDIAEKPKRSKRSSKPKFKEEIRF